MSFITQYRHTLKTQLYANTPRILFVDDKSLKIISLLFSPEEQLDMNIIGVLKIDDKDIDRVNDIFANDIMCFIGSKSIIHLEKIFLNVKLCVSVFFYHHITPSDIETIKNFDVCLKLCEILYGSLNFYPVSDHSVVGPDAITAIKTTPSTIICHKSGEELKLKINSLIEKSHNECSLRERKDNTLLFALERSYDEIGSLIVPWRYQSLINYLNLNIGPPTADTFYSQHKYSYYNEVIDECSQLTNQLNQLNKQSRSHSVDMQFNTNIKTQLVGRHIALLKEIQSSITKLNLLEKSELEQKALIGIANESELIKLSKLNPQLYNILIGERSPNIKAMINTFNIFNVDDTKSNYHQYVLKLREILKDFKMKYNKYDKIYVYIDNYVSYEEIAEIEMSNMSGNPTIYLLSDSIKNNSLESTIVIDQSAKSIDSFRVVKTVIRKIAIPNSDLYFASIETDINFLKKHQMDFDDKIEAQCESIKQSLPAILSKEFARLKNTNKSNKLETNINNIKLKKLAKLASEFNTIYKNDKFKNEYLSKVNTQFFFDNTNTKHSSKNDQKQSLLKFQDDEEMQLEKEIERREQGVNEICQKTIELHAMFVEMSTLVAKQTLILGTIEENIINSSELMTAGNEQLTKADKYQENANNCSDKFIIILFCLILLLCAGIGIKITVVKH